MIPVVSCHLSERLYSHLRLVICVYALSLASRHASCVLLCSTIVHFYVVSYQDRIPSRLWHLVVGARTHGNGARLQGGVGQTSWNTTATWSVLFRGKSECLKIPSRFSGGVRVIHAQHFQHQLSNLTCAAKGRVIYDDSHLLGHLQRATAR